MGQPADVCPFCAEPLPGKVAACPACKEPLGGPAQAPPKKRTSTLALVVIVLGVGALTLAGVVGIVAAIAIPNLIEARKQGNEAAAIGGLKTLVSAQTLFREADKDKDGALQYGDLSALGQAEIIDPILAGGLKQGYRFECRPSPTTPEFLWMATASPAAPGTTGDRYFFVNHAGVVFESRGGPFPFTPDCEPPSGAQPVGAGRRPRGR